MKTWKASCAIKPCRTKNLAGQKTLQDKKKAHPNPSGAPKAFDVGPHPSLKHSVP